MPIYLKPKQNVSAFLYVYENAAESWELIEVVFYNFQALKHIEIGIISALLHFTLGHISRANLISANIGKPRKPDFMTESGFFFSGD